MAIEITKELIKGCMPNLTKANLDKFFDNLKHYMNRFEINTPLRIAHFLAQLGHESGDFRYTHELGNASYFAKYDTGKLAKMLGNTPEADGDGAKYKGRGLIQVTGKANYAAFSKWYWGEKDKNHFVDKPDEVETNNRACVASAAWFWNSRSLNSIADKDDIVLLTKRVNGGTNGLEDRKKRLLAAKKYLKL